MKKMSLFTVGILFVSLISAVFLVGGCFEDPNAAGSGSSCGGTFVTKCDTGLTCCPATNTCITTSQCTQEGQDRLQ